jgi:carboxypeptidase C (cathepsin A)
MTRNPDLKVLFTCGYYDLATPYFDSVYTADHLGLPESLRGNVRISYYEAGHMMYIRKVDHARLKKEIADFVREAVQ